MQRYRRHRRLNGTKLDVSHNEGKKFLHTLILLSNNKNLCSKMIVLYLRAQIKESY